MLSVLTPGKFLPTQDELVTLKREMKGKPTSLESPSIHFGRGNNLQNLFPIEENIDTVIS